MAETKYAGTFRIPETFRGMTNGNAVVPMIGATLGDALDALEATYPALQRQLRTEGRALRPYVRIFVEDHGTLAANEMDAPLGSNSEAWIVCAVAGG